jgi:hypothetical protein
MRSVTRERVALFPKAPPITVVLCRSRSGGIPVLGALSDLCHSIRLCPSLPVGRTARSVSCQTDITTEYTAYSVSAAL